MNMIVHDCLKYEQNLFQFNASRLFWASLPFACFFFVGVGYCPVLVMSLQKTLFCLYSLSGLCTHMIDCVKCYATGKPALTVSHTLDSSSKS